MFTIGFGEGVSDSPTAAPLLRYIADAGDNGVVDNNLQEDWRRNRNSLQHHTLILNNPSHPTGYTAASSAAATFGENDPLLL
ncbi:MAG: hypothetical protein HC915_08595 [Anaerolineae bacterium]|nr:hypothetical protein [Anaerolineae bacterium]